MGFKSNVDLDVTYLCNYSVSEVKTCLACNIFKTFNSALESANFIEVEFWDRIWNKIVDLCGEFLYQIENNLLIKINKKCYCYLNLSAINKF